MYLETDRLIIRSIELTDVKASWLRKEPLL